MKIWHYYKWTLHQWQKTNKQYKNPQKNPKKPTTTTEDYDQGKQQVAQVILDFFLLSSKNVQNQKHLFNL